MKQGKIRAVYMRGGTSRCLVFHAKDLPAPGRERDAILLAALGSPDPYGRQLDGLGGGISSLSKACIIGPPTLPGADVDYTFAQVEVSCVDATNPVVFVRAHDLGLTGTETPQAIDADHDVSARLEKLRVEAAARMGMPESAAVPKIAFVAPPTETTALDGVRYPAE